MTAATVAFKTEFAVDMTCQNCVNAVQESLRDIQGIERYDIDLAQKRVTITGKTPPSHLLTALKSTNRQVIVRGASSTSPTTYPTAAAVSILESPLPLPSSIARTTFPALASSSSSPTPEILPSHKRELPGMTEDEFSQKVFGICRFVQIAPRTILMDLTVRLPPPSAVGLSAGQRAFEVYISTTGNMVDPPTTTGKALVSLGRIEPDKDGYGDLFREVEGELWEWVGRGCVVQATATPGDVRGSAEHGAAGAGSGTGGQGQGTGRIFAGVVARSAGAWGNEKTVCACSGRTMWEEGREMQAKSAL